MTASGEIDTKRLYCGCVFCETNIHPADEHLGINGRYTVGLRDLAVYAAADGSFAKAQKRLRKFCGIDIDENTIKKLCMNEAIKMERWQKTDPLSTLEFQTAEGETEFTTDGTMVNTLDGWREVRIGIFAKRELATSATPEEWSSRKLPKPHVSVAFAAMEEKEVFRRRWGSWANRLKIKDREQDEKKNQGFKQMSTLGDGAHWIGDSMQLEFGETKEILDVYHGLEKLSDCGKALFGAESEGYDSWREATTWKLLDGYDSIHGFLQEKIALESDEDRKSFLEIPDNYLTWHRDRLDYRGRLAAGLAIGSGQVEGACKNLIGARLKQTGARWRGDRVNRMGVICSIFYADQWDAYWKAAQ